MKRGIEVFENNAVPQLVQASTEITKYFQGEASGSTVNILENRHRLLDRPQISNGVTQLNIRKAASHGDELSSSVSILLHCDASLAAAEEALLHALKLPAVGLLGVAEKVMQDDGRERKKEIENLAEKLEGLSSNLASSVELKFALPQRVAAVDLGTDRYKRVQQVHAALSTIVQDLQQIRKCHADLPQVLKGYNSCTMDEARAAAANIDALEKQVAEFQGKFNTEVSGIFCAMDSVHLEIQNLAEVFGPN